MLSQTIMIKPLSVNDAWKGRRSKTPQYKKYYRDVLFLLKTKKLELESFQVFIEFGFSSKGSDIDNPVKPFLDILSKKYGFNDNCIYRLTLEKKIVQKGYEYITFKIAP